MNLKTKTQFVGLIALASLTAHAQSIQRVTEEYRNPEQIKLPAPEALRAKTEQEVMPSVQTNTPPAPRSEPEMKASAVPLAAPPVVPLAIQPGQRLSVALGTWLKSQSIELSWEPAGTLPGRVRDVLIDSAWLASQTSLEPTLSEVLAPFGLTAHVLRQRQSNHASNVTILDASPSSVVVRNASNSRP